MAKLQKRFLGVSCSVLVGVLVLIVFALHERRLGRMEVQARQNREDEAWEQAHRPPEIPVEFLSRRWRVVYGMGEPDTKTPEGRSAFKAEEERLPSARAEFRRILDALPSAFTAADDSGVDVFLAQTKQLLGGFSFHELRGAVLDDVKWERNGLGRLTPSWNEISSESVAKEALRRCYRVRCDIADLLWVRCGDEYAAAQVDYRCYHMLKECGRLFEKRGWQNAGNVVRSYVEQWKRDRCDCPDSNFRRSHEYCEEMYSVCFEERVKKGEGGIMKMWNDHYRFHLTAARAILGRNPKWAPRTD